MADKPYSKREIDSFIAGMQSEIRRLMDATTPFEVDMRQSLSRVEQGLSNIQTHIEARLAEEREKSNKSYAPRVIWTAIITVLTIWAGLEVPAVLKLLHLVTPLP